MFICAFPDVLHTFKLYENCYINFLICFTHSDIRIDLSCISRNPQDYVRPHTMLRTTKVNYTSENNLHKF